jgi:hypothetical protein
LSIERTHGRVVNVPSVLNLVRSVLSSPKGTEQVVEGPTVKDRQQALIHFYQEYETLVETVCDSAQYGPREHLEKRYQIQREWMIQNYGSVRRYVLAYLRLEVEDEGDAFESLFSAPDLATFLQSDDGNMISRIMRTREALNLYGDHLRQLAAAA